jgi:hypothetical protein
LETVAGQLPDHISIRQLPEHAGQEVAVAGVRLPGWTGGRGFYAGDGQTFVVVRSHPDLPLPQPWQPIVVRGRYMNDEWDSHWLQAGEIQAVDRRL